MASQNKESKTRKQKGALVSRLTKLFSRKTSPPPQRGHLDSNTAIYLGDVCDDGGIPYRAEPNSSEKSEYLRSRGPAKVTKREAAVEDGQKLEGSPYFPGSVAEIQPDCSPQQLASAAKAKEQGIAEVLDDKEARLKYRVSPLSTLSSLGAVTGGQPAQEGGVEAPKGHSSHPLLQSVQLAPEPIVPALSLDDGQQMSHPSMMDSGDILSTWEETMFGPVGPEDKAAADSKKRPSSLLNTDSSAGRQSSRDSQRSHKTAAAACRSPAKQQRKAGWATGARSRHTVGAPDGTRPLSGQQLPRDRRPSVVVPQLKLNSAIGGVEGSPRGPPAAAIKTLPLPETDEEWQSQHPRQQRREARRQQEEVLHKKQGRAGLNTVSGTLGHSKPSAQPLRDANSRPTIPQAEPEDWRFLERPLRKNTGSGAVLAARLAEYAVSADVSDPAHVQRRPQQERMKAARRVRFNDEPSGKAVEEAMLARLRAERQRKSSGARDADRESYNADRSYHFGSDEENEAALEEALAQVASLPDDGEPNTPGGPLHSPSRFLQSAEEPSPPREASPDGGLQMQDWDERVSMQLEFAKTLSGSNPARVKSDDKKLQRVKYGIVTEEMLPPEASSYPPMDDAYSQEPRAPSGQPSGPAQHHFASHSSTTMLMKAAAAKSDPHALPPMPPQRYISRRVVPPRAAIAAIEARRVPVLSSSKTGPLWTAPVGDWEQSTATSYHPVDPNSYPVSIPGSPGSSLRGHALSHVTYSPGRYPGMPWRSNSLGQEPWAPEMQAVEEGREGEAMALHSLAEMSALSFRPAPQLKPQAAKLTQATLQSRAVLDTVGCDVDLALLRSIWPPGRSPSPAPLSVATDQLLPPKSQDGELWQTPVDHRLPGITALQTTPSDYWFSRGPGRVSQFV